MKSPVLRSLVQLLTGRSLATEPAVWGKLPSHGDFVHHRVPMSERQAWHDWVEAIWFKRPHAQSKTSKKGCDLAVNWIALDAVRPVSRLHQVPIAFVLPPGSLSFAPFEHVQGVMVPSSDKVGRSCPLIIYQKVKPSWMQRQLQMDAQMSGQTLLFWWARLAWQAVEGDLPLSEWLQRLDAVWTLQAPGLAQWMGAAPQQPDLQRLTQLLGHDPFNDPAYDLRGVYHLPWVDWPTRVTRALQPEAAFWTQDAQGGYLQAANSLLQLWGRE